jgi:thiamine pyrophosphate-dependent acetolactate synthase large subunit-like protein
VQIDIDSRDIARTYPVALGIQADAGETLAALLEGLSQARIPASRAAWQQETEGLRAQRQTRLQGEANSPRCPSVPMSNSRVRP